MSLGMGGWEFFCDPAACEAGGGADVIGSVGDGNSCTKDVWLLKGWSVQIGYQNSLVSSGD